MRLSNFFKAMQLVSANVAIRAEPAALHSLASSQMPSPLCNTGASQSNTAFSLNVKIHFFPQKLVVLSDYVKSYFETLVLADAMVLV